MIWWDPGSSPFATALWEKNTSCHYLADINHDVGLYPLTAHGKRLQRQHCALRRGYWCCFLSLCHGTVSAFRWRHPSVCHRSPRLPDAPLLPLSEVLFQASSPHGWYTLFYVAPVPIDVQWRNVIVCSCVTIWQKGHVSEAVSLDGPLPQDLCNGSIHCPSCSFKVPITFVISWPQMIFGTCLIHAVAHCCTAMTVRAQDSKVNDQACENVYHTTKAIVWLVSPGHPWCIIGHTDVPHGSLSAYASLTHVAALSSICVVWETGRWCFTYVFWCIHGESGHQQSRRKPENPTPLSIVPASMRLVVVKGARLSWFPRRDEESVSLITCWQSRQSVRNVTTGPFCTSMTSTVRNAPWQLGHGKFFTMFFNDETCTNRQLSSVTILASGPS